MKDKAAFNWTYQGGTMKNSRTFISNDRHFSVKPEDLSERWCISAHQAQMILNVTTKS